MARGLAEGLTQSVLVTGASGQVGLFAVALLAGAGYVVYAASRSPRPDWYPELVNVTWIREFSEIPETDIPSCHLCSTGPLSLALEWARIGSISGDVVALSTSSIQTKSSSADDSERKLINQLARDEQELEALCKTGNRSCCILRPTLIYGCGMDRNLSLLLKFVKRFGFLPVSRKALGTRQPIHAEDLATAMVLALRAAKPGAWVSPVVGGESMSYHEMAERLCSVLDKKSTLVRVPESLLIAGVNMAGWFKPNLTVNAEMVKRQSMDLEFDDANFRSITGFKARPFMPKARDFNLPTAEYIISLAGE